MIDDPSHTTEVAAPLAGRTLTVGDAAFAVAERTDAGGPPGPPGLIAPPHVHHTDDEAWYVLEGTLRFRIGGQEIEAPAGAAVFGPQGVAHTFWNPGPGPARYLIVMTRNTVRLLAELHTTTDCSPEAMRALFAKYDCELLG